MNSLIFFNIQLLKSNSKYLPLNINYCSNLANAFEIKQSLSLPYPSIVVFNLWHNLFGNLIFNCIINNFFFAFKTSRFVAIPQKLLVAIIGCSIVFQLELVFDGISSSDIISFSIRKCFHIIHHYRALL